MSKKKYSIFRIFILIALASGCYYSITLIKTNFEINAKQSDENVNDLLTPKTSGILHERWNYTSTSTMWSMAVSSDGKYMAAGEEYVGSTPGKVHFFNTSVHDGTPEWSYNTGQNDVNKIAISDNGSYIVAISDDTAFLLNSSKPENGIKQEVWNVSISGFTINAVDISADGHSILLGGDDSGSGIVLAFNYTLNSTGGHDKSNEYLWFYQTDYPVLSVAISDEGDCIVAGTDDDGSNTQGLVFFFNNTDYTIGFEHIPMWILPERDYSCPIDQIAISDDGGYILAGCNDYGSTGYGYALLLDKEAPVSGDKEEIWYIDYEWYGEITSIDISANGKYIVIGDTDEYVTVFDNSLASVGLDKTDDYLWWYETSQGVTSVSISDDGMYIAAGTMYTPFPSGELYENTVFLFKNPRVYMEQLEPMDWFNTSENVYSVSISASGNYIAALGDYTSGSRTYLFYKDIPIPQVAGDDDDDDDGEEKAAIPFGSYYLLFAFFAVVSLILIYKRKAILSKK